MPTPTFRDGGTTSGTQDFTSDKRLLLNAVNVNLVAFASQLHDITGQVFALFVIAVAAAEVGIGLAIVILLFRNRATIDVDEVDLLKW